MMNKLIILKKILYEIIMSKGHLNKSFLGLQWTNCTEHQLDNNIGKHSLKLRTRSNHRTSLTLCQG